MDSLRTLGLDFVTDGDRLTAYGQDWTRFHVPRPRAIVFPRSADEVSRLLKHCSEHRIAVVPSGGRTGLAGGAVASNGEVVLSLDRLNAVHPVDLVASTVRVGAGVVHETLQDHVKGHGLQWPVDLASKGSCQIGGNLATNAGGLRVIRYGHARAWVQSLEVVFADGSINELNGDLEKNNTGYDLRHLMIGSEGTLGVITAATLKLCPLPGESSVLLLGASGFDKILEVLRRARTDHLPLLAFESWTRACVDTVMHEMGFPEPLGSSCPVYALVEIEHSPRVDLDAWITRVLEDGLALDGTLASDAEGSRRLWRYRENITESLARRGLVYKNDLALPLRQLPDFVRTLESSTARWYPACEVFIFGHVGDGNLHVNVLNTSTRTREEFLSLCERSNEDLFESIQSLGGSIAAEHGIGLLKKKYLQYSRTPAELAAFRGIKRAFDPAGILNPGKIFDLDR